MKLTFLIKFWDGIKSLFGTLDKTIQEDIRVSVVVVEGLKTATDSPIADVVVGLIPGDTDNKILAAARVILPKILDELELTVAKYQTLTGDVKSAMSGAIATNLARELTGFKVSYDDTKALVANVYKNEVKNAA